jgi:uncharacterized protein (TIGR02996 family)
MMHEAQLLSALAERPFDKSLRLVFADVLLERGDARGEVIALYERGSLSLTEKTRIRRLTEQHAKAWLGPLAPVVDISKCRWVGGFVESLVVAAEVDPLRWEALAGEPRLATVRQLSFPLLPLKPQVRAFLAHQVLASVSALRAPLPLLESLVGRALPFVLESLTVTTWGPGDDVLGQVPTLLSTPAFGSIQRLEFAPVDIVDAVVGSQVARAVCASARLVRAAPQLRLVADYETVEGLCAWLKHSSDRSLSSRWGQGLRWSVAKGALVFGVGGDERGRHRLWAELGDELQLLESRFAMLLAVLSQLKSLGLSAIEVSLPERGQLTLKERTELTSLARRLGSIEAVAVNGEALNVKARQP